MMLSGVSALFEHAMGMMLFNMIFFIFGASGKSLEDELFDFGFVVVFRMGGGGFCLFEGAHQVLEGGGLVGFTFHGLYYTITDILTQLALLLHY